MEERQLHINYIRYDHPDEIPEDEARLLSRALEAARDAYAPYSGFGVGCAVLLDDGEIYAGNNQENVAFPSAMCAERSVLYYLGAQKKAPKIRKMAIRALSNKKDINEPPPPCGGCRQAMVEYEKQAGQPIVVLMQGESGSVLRLEGVAKSLMPFNFDLEF